MYKYNRERYNRWQGYRISQFSSSVNLFLSFAVASLGFAINLKLNNNFNNIYMLVTVIKFWSFSALFGSIVTISRLIDFRLTARKVKTGRACYSLIAKKFGLITWTFFYLQVIAYAVGALLFINGVV